jgi:hypothetical protein
MENLRELLVEDSKGKRPKSSKQAKADRQALLPSKLQAESLKVHGDPLDTPKKAPANGKEGEVVPVDASDFIAIIDRRRAEFHAQRRPGPQEHMDETARLIAEEYDALLAEIEVAAKQPEAERKNKRS